MKWSQKVSLAGSVGIASSSLLLGLGSVRGLGDFSLDARSHDIVGGTSSSVDRTSSSNTFERARKIQQLQLSSLAVGGGIAYLTAARLFKRVRPFRLYATAAALMLAVVPFHYFVTYGKSTATEKSGKPSRKRSLLAYVRASMPLFATILALVAKATA